MDNQQNQSVAELREQSEENVHRSPPGSWTSVIPRLAVGSLVLLPFAFVPYLLVRRQLIALRRSAEAINSTFELAQRELRAAALENARLGKDDQVQTKVLLRHIQWDVDRLRQDVAALQSSQASSHNEMRHNQESFDAEKQRIWSQLTILQELGLSLADVAAFMYEIELKGGYTGRSGDAHGIERLRQTAMKLQKLQDREV
ncbi:hypothetical protein NEOLEDRAFT_1140265 [Neolentinus lepideus HHB14362 ss-1]|uniref:Peroxin-14 n=1 Tax=Neolentinus lepideus HHB14362 ss-1 TaxID=1314782 RepID=A0A165PA59_9AGAM|nr:hypothetical protein NEOLEDRAFT_1140265 [Neolentinus lepideus HHB14362 ss-1]